MSKFVTKIALVLFMVFGMASVVNGAMITSSEQEAIDKLKAKSEELLKDLNLEKPKYELCIARHYNYDYSVFCEVEKFFAFVEFYRNYGGEFDGQKAWAKAYDENKKLELEGKMLEQKYYIWSREEKMIQHAEALMRDLEDKRLRAGAIRVNGQMR